MLRRLRLVLLGGAGAILLALLAAHAPPARAVVLRRVVEAARRSYAIDLAAESLSYNVLTLSADLHGVRVADAHTPAEPFAAADAVAVAFGLGTLIGDVSVTRLSIVSPRIDIRRHPDGTDNLPRVTTSASRGAAIGVPPIRVDNLDVSFQHPSTSARMRGAALQLTTAGGRVSATLTASHGLTLTVADREITLDRAAAVFDVEGDRLSLRDLTASRPGGVLHATGSIALRGDASTVDLTVHGSSTLESWSRETDAQTGTPVGRVDVTARVTGPVSEPSITFETSAGSLAWSDLRVAEVRARGGYRAGELSLDSVTLGIAGGTVEAQGAIALDDARRASRVTARWDRVDARRIPAIASLEGTVATSGTAVVEWRADGAATSPRFDVTATTGIVASGRTTPIVVHGSGRGDRWHVEMSPRDPSGVSVTATADIGVVPERWQASTIDGSVVLRTTDLAGLIRQARDFGVPATVDPSTAVGAVDVEATIDGTLAAIRSTGRIVSHSVTLAGLPRLDLDASFGIDVARNTSTGSFRVLAPGLESAALPGMTLGGSLVAAGTWSGSLSNPTVDATVTGRHLTIGRGGSMPLDATGGAFDGTLKGPITNPRGQGTLTMGSVAIGGRGAGAVVADLTVSSGTLRVDARAPSVKTTVDLSIGLEEPNAFDGHATLAESDIDALVGMTGLGAVDPGSVRGRVSSTIAFTGDLRNRSSTTMTMDVAPIEATVFDVPIAMSRGLHATLTHGDLQIENVAMLVGGVSVSIGGTLATDRSSAAVVLDVDGDVSPLTPWLRRLSGSPDLGAAGRITGHLETNATPAGLATTGTVETTLSALSNGDRILATDVRAAIVLAGQRARVRDAAGSVLGGRLTANADAPLDWLNQWLPSGLQIASPPTAAPATLAGTASFDVPALFGLFARAPIDALEGRIELSAKLTASRPDPKALAGSVTFERAELRSKGLTYTQSDVTRFRLADGAVTIEHLDWHGPGTKVVGRGSVGFGVGGSVLNGGLDSNLRLDVDTELGIIGTLLSGRATGRLEGNIELHGPSDALRVTSEATLRDASWLVPGQRILFAGWSGDVRLADQALSVTKLGGRVNGGTIRIDGRLPLDAADDGGGLTIAARDILLDVPRGLHSQLGADLVWRRESGAARLQGTVEITANRYTEPVTRMLSLVNSLSSATGSSGGSPLPPWLADTALDIGLTVTDPIVIDNSVGAVELIPELRLGGTIESPALSGHVAALDNGRVTIGGRLYRLRDSQVRFAPADGLVPTLDAIGDTRIGDYEVTIRISGTADRIETSFSSVPPLGERELQSLIVTGQTGEPSSQGRQSEDKFAAAAAATDILGFAGKFVGLDSVRVGASDLDLVSKDVTTAQHLTVSKSLGSSFDLIFSENLEEGSVTWVLVWKPTPVNEIRASSVEDGTRGIEFRRTIVFGPGAAARTANVRRAAADQLPTIVDAVRITGAPGFSEAELSRKLRLGAGDRFDVRRWIEDRHRLENWYQDRGYQRVRIASTRSEAADRSHVTLTYDIERGPQTVIETTGDPLPGKVLEAMYDAWRGLPIADVVRTEFDRIAREGLARRGYYRPDVQIDFSAETPELARVTLHLVRGPQTRQLTIAWAGNRDVSNVDLDALVAPHRAQSAVWLDSQSLAWQIRQLYASRGHLQAQVTVGEPAFHDPDATLPIAIDEGVLSRLSGVQLEGVDPARRMAATEALGLSIGEPLAAAAPRDAARRLKAFYAGLGYRTATVTPTLTTAGDGSVSIAWAVTEGPLYRVKDVNVVGVETTSDRLVEKAIALSPGDAMSQTGIDSTRRNLYDIGSFRRVDFEVEDSAILPAAGELPLTLTIQAEEPQRFQLKYGVQFNADQSTGSGSRAAFGASVEFRDRNFLGRAVQASVGAHWDPDLQTIGLLFSSPRFLGKRVRTSVYARDRREQDVLDSSSSLEGALLDDRRRELTFEQRWRPASAWELVWGYNVSSRRFLLDRDAEHRDAGGLLAGPVVSVILDRRDSPFDATRGLFHSSSFQFGAQSLGSDLDYIRYLVRQSYYQPLGKVTAAASVRYGMIQDYSGTAPISIIDILFNAGGTNTVRGYPEDSLSAINLAGFSLGGTELLVLNGELRFPITKRLGAAAFVDAGNTFANVADVALGRLAVGAGLGVRIRTPLAPFRLDFAYPFSDAYGQHGIRIHFSIGQMF